MRKSGLFWLLVPLRVLILNYYQQRVTFLINSGTLLVNEGKPTLYIEIAGKKVGLLVYNLVFSCAKVLNLFFSKGVQICNFGGYILRLY